MKQRYFFLIFLALIALFGTNSLNALATISLSDNEIGDTRIDDAAGAGKGVIYVTPDGVALPPGTKIPANLIENPFGRAGSYGIIDPATGKFVETLRIDPATLPGFKGPNYSHFHLNGSSKHLTDMTKWSGGAE